MATYQKRGDKWRVIVRKKGITQSATFTLKKDAEAWARKIEIQIERGVPLDADDITVGALIGRYIAEILPKHKSGERELVGLRKFIRDYPLLINKRAVDFSKTDIVYWRDKRLKHVKSESVRREWVILSSIFTHAVKTWGVLEINPFLHVAKPEKSPTRDARINDEEIAIVQEAFGYDGLKSPESLRQYTAWAFLFALETACRLGEITKLEPQDVHDDLIHLRDTKNGGDRFVPLSARAKRLLSLVSLPLPYDSQKLSRCFVTYKPESLAHLRFHDTRHEAISRMALKINNPLVLAKITGHKDLKILLNTYYNPNGSDLVGLLD